MVAQEVSESARGLSREVRIGSKRAGTVSPAARTRVVATPRGLRAVTPYTTRPYGNLTLDPGERKHKVPSRLRLDRSAGRRVSPPSW